MRSQVSLQVSPFFRFRYAQTPGSRSWDIGLFPARTNRNEADGRTREFAAPRRRRRRRLVHSILLHHRHVSSSPFSNTDTSTPFDASPARRGRRDTLPHPRTLPADTPGTGTDRTRSRVLAQPWRQRAGSTLSALSAERGQVLAGGEFGR